jgi:LysR family transcriptional regulator, hydrogen peroxide-inducible genes activator
MVGLVHPRARPTGDLEVIIMRCRAKKSTNKRMLQPLFTEQMVIAVHRQHRLANEHGFPAKELNGEHYIHRMNCEFAGYADNILQERGVTCTPTFWSERDDRTLAMVAAGLGFAFMPANSVNHPDVIGVPIVEPECWRQVNLVTGRGRPYCARTVQPGVGATSLTHGHCCFCARVQGQQVGRIDGGLLDKLV